MGEGRGLSDVSLQLAGSVVALALLGSDGWLLDVTSVCCVCEIEGSGALAGITRVSTTGEITGGEDSFPATTSPSLTSSSNPNNSWTVEGLAGRVAEFRPPGSFCVIGNGGAELGGL